MSVKEKLASLGLTLPTAAAPVAAYVPAVKTGNLVFTAGQLPVVDGKLVLTGKVGSDVTPEDAKKMAEICALNALAAISLVADIDQIEKIVRVGGFVNGVPGFVAIPAVINGASELLIKLFGDVNGKHARTAVGVADAVIGCQFGGGAAERFYIMPVRDLGCYFGYAESAEYASGGAKLTSGVGAMTVSNGYINGSPVATLSNTIGSALPKILIGNMAFGVAGSETPVAGRYFNGKIQAIAIYNNTLTAPQVLAVSTAMAALT